MRLAARAYAKVNLVLSVGPPLPKEAGPAAGYHPIASWFHALSLWDDLELHLLTPGEPSRHEIAWAADAPRPTPIDWPLERDLAVRAHRLLEQETRRELPAALKLRKRIPVGGGLGGGSSDAAAMLQALDAAFNLGLGRERLARLSTRLGSDVAFFINAPPGAPADALLAPPRPAIVTGLGDEIERVAPIGPGRSPGPSEVGGASEAPGIVLIFPPFGCPTGPVYRAYDAGPRPLDVARVTDLVHSAIASGRIDSCGLFNDLAAPAEAVAPALAPLRREAARRLARPVHVTGSGSTLFALAQGDSADADAARLGDLDGGCVAVGARLV